MSELFESAIRGKATEKPKTVSSQRVPKRVIDLHRNTQKLPQAIIKVSSYSKTHSKASAHVDYITRHSKSCDDLPVEMSDGAIIHDHEDVAEVIDSWCAEEEIRHNARRVVNIVLSSPAGSDVEQVKASVRDFVGEYFEKHESLFVVHTDTNNPHAHLCVKTRSHEGEQLRLGRAELKEMKDLYSDKLRENGIEVHSSYRSDRGQWTRSVTQAVHHMNASDVEHKREERFAFKPLDPDHPSQVSLQRCHERTQNEYLGAALFLRKAYGAEFETEAQDLERYGQQLHRPGQAAQIASEQDEEIER